MDASSIARAAALLLEARAPGARRDRLAEDCRPASVADAFAIQAEMARRLGEPVAGWKVGSAVEGRTTYGIVVASRLLPSGCTIRAADMPMLGMEAEIAFRFTRDVPPRAEPYTRDEVASCVAARVAIEVVDSRYRDYAGTPAVERIADFMSNGALVCGSEPAGWRGHDLSRLTATVTFDGREVVRQTGGHSAGDPLLPAVDLVNALRTEGGVRAGQIMTTGTCTGIQYATGVRRVAVEFEGFGRAELAIEA
jgi:2-keto-4-pentenoate hydratase